MRKMTVEEEGEEEFRYEQCLIYRDKSRFFLTFKSPSSAYRVIELATVTVRILEIEPYPVLILIFSVVYISPRSSQNFAV